MLLRALAELRMEHSSEDMTATLVNGHCLELTGRRRQEGQTVPITVRMPKEPKEKAKANPPPSSPPLGNAPHRPRRQPFQP